MGRSLDSSKSILVGHLCRSYDTILDWHPFTRLALEMVGEATLSQDNSLLLIDTVGTSHTIDSFHIYTDGTAKDGEAAWGMVALAKAVNGFFTGWDSQVDSSRQLRASRFYWRGIKLTHVEYNVHTYK